MGNSLGAGPGSVPVCLGLGETSRPSSTWEPERTVSSIFSPTRMVQDNGDGGANGSDTFEHIPWRPTEEILADMKNSEAYKTFMQPFNDAKAMDAAESEEEEPILEGNYAGVSENENQDFKETLKTNLHKLKEKTGLPYAFCKKALEKNNNDLDQAEKWLEQESKELGLEKLKKIKDRKSAEGLVGIAWDKHHAAMVEVNSESDFVSSNDKFHAFVDVVVKSCLQHTKENNPSPKTLSKVMLNEDELGNLVAADKQSLSDHLNKTIALIGERLRLRRAALISAEESARVAVLTHSSSESADYKNQGRIGTVLVYKADDYNDVTLQHAKNICQQIIGMNPKTIETLEGGDQETALLSQRYIREPSETVGDFAIRAGLKIQHFVRFERGEPGNDPDELGTEPAKPLC